MTEDERRRALSGLPLELRQAYDKVVETRNRYPVMGILTRNWTF